MSWVSVRGFALFASTLPAQRSGRADLTLVKVSQCKARKVARLESNAARDSMKARDIMTRDVVTVSPDTPVRDIAALMVEKPRAESDKPRSIKIG